MSKIEDLHFLIGARITRIEIEGGKIVIGVRDTDGKHGSIVGPLPFSIERLDTNEDEVKA